MSYRTVHVTDETEVSPRAGETRLECIARETVGNLVSRLSTRSEYGTRSTTPLTVARNAALTISADDAHYVLTVMHKAGWVGRREPEDIKGDAGVKMIRQNYEAFYIDDSWDREVTVLRKLIDHSTGPAARLFERLSYVDDEKLREVRTFVENGPVTAAAIEAGTGINNGTVNRALRVLEQYAEVVEGPKGYDGARLWVPAAWYVNAPWLRHVIDSHSQPKD